jgi:HK97 gp10 family phage protein
MLNIKFDFSRMSAKLDEIEAAIKDAVRLAAHAGAKVLYEAAMSKVPVANAPHYDSSTGKLYPGGDLRRSLYRAFAEKQSKEAGAGYSRATYRVSWNSGRTKKRSHGYAAHGHFLEGRGTSLGDMEFGHWQPFVVHKDEKTGNWYTIVRPEMRGKPLPKSNAPMSEKLKFFYPWPGGPRWTPAQPFLRPAYDQNIDFALRAANSVMIQKVREVL